MRRPRVRTRAVDPESMRRRRLARLRRDVAWNASCLALVAAAMTLWFGHASKVRASPDLRPLYIVGAACGFLALGIAVTMLVGSVRDYRDAKKRLGVD